MAKLASGRLTQLPEINDVKPTEHGDFERSGDLFAGDDFKRLSERYDAMDRGRVAGEEKDTRPAGISTLTRAAITGALALFSHNMQLMAVQQQLIETQEELRTLRAKADERTKYVLHEISKQTYVYKLITPSHAFTGGFSEQNVVPLHYLCQPCFDKGAKAVLQRTESLGTVFLGCSLCKEQFATGETSPLRF